MALIIDAPMPKGCEWTDKTSRTGMGYCQLKDKCMAYRKEVSKQWTINAHPIDYIPSDCPIIGEIPDSHGRLISDTDVKALLRSGLSLDSDSDLDYVCRLIDGLPTIVEATE